MVDCLDASNMNFFLNGLKYQTPNVGHLSFEEYLNDSEMNFLHNHLPVASRHWEKIAAAVLVAAEEKGELTAITAEDNRDDESDDSTWI